MKSLFTSVLVLVSILGQAQTSITLTVKGLSDALNDSLQYGEHLQNMVKLDRRSFLFYAKVQNADGGASQYVRIQDEVKPDENGRYDFSISFDVKQKSGLDFSKPIKVLIDGNTTFGNSVWAEKAIEPKDFDKPIEITEYGSKMKYNKIIKKHLILTFQTPREGSKIANKVKEQGDSLKKLKGEDFHLLIKNEGSEKWAINEFAKDREVNSGATLAYRIDPAKSNLDFSKPMLMQVSMRTANGGFIHNTWKLNPSELGGRYKLNKIYSKNNPFDQVGVNVMPAKKKVVEKISSPKAKEEPKKLDNTSKSIPTKVAVPAKPATEKVEVVKTEVAVEKDKCVQDSLVKLISLTGGKMCVTGLSVSRGIKNSAKLLYNSEYSIGENSFPIKGGAKISYHNKKSYLMTATLEANTTVKLKMGELKLKGNSPIEFWAQGVRKVKLEGTSSLTFKGKTLKASTTNNKYDLELDALGRLSSLTLAETVGWSMSTGEFNIPKGSYLKFKNGNLERVVLTNGTELMLFGKAFKVQPKEKKPSIKFVAENVVESLISGEGNTVEVAGYLVEVQPGSEIELEFVNGKYVITSVVTNKSITVNQYKGSKVKEVEAKKGKKLVIEDAKVVKVK